MDHLIYAHGEGYSKAGMITIPKGVTITFLHYMEKLIDSPFEIKRIGNIQPPIIRGEFSEKKQYITERVVERFIPKQQIFNNIQNQLLSIGLPIVPSIK